MCLNRTSEWHVMTIGISLDFSLFNFECLDISWASIVHPCQMLLSSKLDQSFLVQFRASRYIMCLNQTSEWNGMTIWISLNFRFSISSVLIHHGPQSYTSVKSYGRLNSTCASVFNFERFDKLCAWIGHPSEKLRPFEFLENFHFSISSAFIYHGPQSYIHLKSYGHLNWTRAFVFNFERLDILWTWIGHPSKILTIGISLELPLLNLERLDISWDSIVHPC